ncbi:hypothetical protein IHE44_0008566 [Lamprotornis superbus]|uniref:Uncharacterized protein n=1 Tax=Lamprotornis superbus TaxID=245042 RepID=A0A835NLB7_9PASS|nr:hypothetical protein IHE44_0008566 [Lamprotornis superbus]
MWTQRRRQNRQFTGIQQVCWPRAALGSWDAPQSSARLQVAKALPSPCPHGVELTAAMHE